MLAGRHFSLNEFLADNAFYFTHLAFFTQVDDGDGCTCFSGASRTSAAVRVAFRIIGQAVIDDMGKVVNVQAACGHIGGYQQLQVAYAELLHDGIALRLAQFAVQSVGVVTFLHQFVDFLCFLTGTAENDTVYLRVIIHDTFQSGVFIFGMNGENHVFHVVCAFILASDGNFLGVVQVFFGNTCYFRAHGSGEQQRVALLGHVCQNGVDAVRESHVQHLVRLIENDVLYVA